MHYRAIFRGQNKTKLLRTPVAKKRKILTNNHKTFIQLNKKIVLESKMRTNFLRLVLVLLLIGNVSFAKGGHSGKRPRTGRSIYTHTDNSLRDVDSKIKELINDGVAPKKILLVLDVDGTLTNSRDPNAHPEGGLRPREHAVEFVTSMKNVGVRVVISSAWNVFSETLIRLKQIGLGPVFDLDLYDESQLRNLTNEDLCTSDDLEVEGVKFYTCTFEEIASVRKDENEQYFRHKALAYKLVYPEIDDEKMKHIFFVDDSATNIRIFKNDVNEYNLFRDTDVTLYQLSAP